MCETIHMYVGIDTDWSAFCQFFLQHRKFCITSGMAPTIIDCLAKLAGMTQRTFRLTETRCMISTSLMPMPFSEKQIRLLMLSNMILIIP